MHHIPTDDEKPGRVPGNCTGDNMYQKGLPTIAINLTFDEPRGLAEAYTRYMGMTTVLTRSRGKRRLQLKLMTLRYNPVPPLGVQVLPCSHRLKTAVRILYPWEFNFPRDACNYW